MVPYLLRRPESDPLWYENGYGAFVSPETPDALKRAAGEPLGSKQQPARRPALGETQAQPEVKQPESSGRSTVSKIFSVMPRALGSPTAVMDPVMAYQYKQLLARDGQSVPDAEVGAYLGGKLNDYEGNLDALKSDINEWFMRTGGFYA